MKIRQHKGKRANLVLIISCLFLIALKLNSAQHASVCPQVDQFTSDNKTLNDHYQIYLSSDEYQQGLLQRFSAAIRIPTVSYDFMRGGPGTTPVNDSALYKPYLEFHKFLQAAYPLTHKYLTLDVINQYSLLYRWQGNDESLKPGMLMSHIDVVPVDPSTVGNWLFPPFSGVVSEGRLYGRGTTDTKLTLIGIMEAAESLLSSGFTPERTMFLSFGHDEEISGYNGISKIVDHLQTVYKIGKNGIEFVSDEGIPVVSMNSDLISFDEAGSLLAAVGVSEKGYTDLNITIHMNKGGHASLPPDHTAIGILSQIITKLEANPFPLFVFEGNPIIGQLKCIGEHSDLLSTIQKFALNHLSVSLPYIYSWFSKVPLLKASISTTQSADIISGGVKVNAIPTSTFGVLNIRVNPSSSVEEVAERVTKLIEPVAKMHNLGLHIVVDSHGVQKLMANNTDFSGIITLQFRASLEPSPISSTETRTFATFSSVIRRVFDNVTVSPGLMIANTDTKFVWNLTSNIYRFSPYVSDGKENVHTVNENARLDSISNSVKFYHELIRAFS